MERRYARLLRSLRVTRPPSNDVHLMLHGTPLVRKSSACEVSQSTVMRGNTQLRERASREAAARPKLFAHYALRWPDGRPEDAACIAELSSEHGFSKKLAARFPKVFDESWAYIRQNQSEVAADARPGPQSCELHLVLRGCRLEL